MDFMNKLERRFGRFAIRHLTRYIILAYAIGYVLWVISAISGASIFQWISLNPDAILRGEIWRLVTWLFVPPTSFNIWTIIMLIVYYQLGTALEKIWGDFLYNFYIFLGMALTVVGAFVMRFIGGAGFFDLYESSSFGTLFTTYYVSLSIFLGFAMTFPDTKMLLFFFIPIKIKYLAVIDLAYLTFDLIVGTWVTRVQIISSLASTLIFYLMTRKHRFSEARRHARFQKQVRQGMQARYVDTKQKDKRKAPGRRPGFTGTGNTGSGARNGSVGGADKEPGFGAIREPGSGSNNGAAHGSGSGARAGNAIHRCTICGRTELDNPGLEFRYCTKCAGNHEYCSDHLFTHIHIQ